MMKQDDADKQDQDANPDAAADATNADQPQKTDWITHYLNLSD